MVGKTFGYVYIMRSEHMAGLKIGFTTKSIAEREQELNTTGVVSPLKAIYFALVESPYDVEQLTHKKLSKYRVSMNREFFDCKLSLAKETILNSIEELKLKLHEIHDLAKEDGSLDECLVLQIWPNAIQGFANKILCDAQQEARRVELAHEILLKQYPQNPSDIPTLTDWLLNFRKRENLLKTFEFLTESKKVLKSVSDMMTSSEFEQSWEEMQQYIIDVIFRPLHSHKAHKLRVNGFHVLDLEIKKYINFIKKETSFINHEKDIRLLEKEIAGIESIFLDMNNKFPTTVGHINSPDWLQFFQEIKTWKNELRHSQERIYDRVDSLQKSTEIGGPLFLEIYGHFTACEFNDESAKFISDKALSLLFPLIDEENHDDIFSLLKARILDVDKQLQAVEERFWSYKPSF
jgi:hypothetical protein